MHYNGEIVQYALFYLISLFLIFLKYRIKERLVGIHQVFAGLGIGIKLAVFQVVGTLDSV